MKLEPIPTELFAGGHVVHLATLLECIDLISDAYIGTPFAMRSGNVFVVVTDAQGSAELPFTDK